MIKVLQIFSSYGGGISSLILNLVENTVGEVQHTLLAFNLKGAEAFTSRVEAAGGRVLQMARPRLNAHICSGLREFYRSIDAAFEGQQYDAVHCHIGGKFLPLFYHAAKRHGVKHIIVHAHKTLEEKSIDRLLPVRALNKWCNHRFSTLYMTCGRLASDYIFGTGYQKDRQCYLIPNGMDHSKFGTAITDEQRRAYRSEFGIDEGSLVICHVGRFTKQKNHPFILDVLRRLQSRGLKFTFVDVGHGEDFDKVTTQAKEMGLDACTRFVGRRSDIAGVMQLADLVILPSLWEGLPTVAIECQAAGTPMMAADTITPECDMKLGLMQFLPLDPDAWVDAIVAFKPHRLVPAHCVSQIASQGFSAAAAGKIYADHLRQITSIG